MKNIDLLKYPVFSEKTNALLQLNKYSFLVYKNLNKKNAQVLIKSLFSVKIQTINTFLLPSKRRRLGKHVGFKTFYKRLIVTLQKGSVIPFSKF